MLSLKQSLHLTLPYTTLFPTMLATKSLAALFGALSTVVVKAQAPQGTLYIDNLCTFPMYLYYDDPELPVNTTLPANTPDAFDRQYLYFTTPTHVKLNTVDDFSSGYMNLQYQYKSVDGFVDYHLDTTNGNPLETYGFGVGHNVPEDPVQNCPANAGIDGCPDVWEPNGSMPNFTIPYTDWIVLRLCGTF